MTRRLIQSTTQVSATARGVLALLAAGALWGLVIVGPELAGGASAGALVGGRFAVLGLVAFVAARGRLRRRDWRRALWYAFAGFVGYYLLLVLGIGMVGAAPAAVMVGITPVLYAIAGARQEQLDVRRLAAPLAVVLLGLLLVHAMDLGAAPVGGLGQAVLGLGLVLASVLLWIVYGLGNGRHLRTSGVGATEWTNTVGMAAGALAAPLLGHAALTGGVGPAPGRWLAVILVLGAGSAWLGTVAWNAAAALLPDSLIGPLLVGELLIGLAYAHGVAGSLPDPVSAAGYLLLVGGGAYSVRRVQQLT